MLTMSTNVSKASAKKLLPKIINGLGGKRAFVKYLAGAGLLASLGSMGFAAKHFAPVRTQETCNAVRGCVKGGVKSAENAGARVTKKVRNTTALARLLR